MDVIEVDLFHPEPLERGFTSAAHIVGAVVDSAGVFARLPHDAELGGDLHVRAGLGEEAADQFLVMVRAIGVGGIEKVDTEINRPTRQQVNTGGDPVVYVTLLDAQKLQFDLAPPAARVQLSRGAAGGNLDIVNAVIARLDPNASADAVAQAVRRWKHLSAITQEQQELILTQSLVDRARRQIGLFTSLLLGVSAVIIALIIYTMTMEKLKQTATLKLIGAPDRTIVGMIVQQSLALGLIGFSIGATLIATIKDHFPRRVVLEADNVAALGLVVFVVCVLASGLGVRSALRVDPATALGG